MKIVQVSGGKEGPEVLDQSGNRLTPLPRNKKIDLHDTDAVRRELAAVYRDARAGKIATSDATRLGYLLNLLLRAFEPTDSKKIDQHLSLDMSALTDEELVNLEDLIRKCRSTG